MKRLTIATRQSRLAMWQAEHVKARLEVAHPWLAVDLLPLTTTGDERLEVRLDKIGGKGLFVKELEVALAERRADIAVHSMKDVPADLPPGFRLCAAMTREDPRDAFVSNRHGSFGEMPAGARVGTSSLRRAAQVAARHPSLAIHTLRGNVLTRLEKLDRGDYDAVVLAAAGLNRLGLADRIRRHLDVEESLPAAGQGILGIECLEGRPEIDALMAPLADPVAEACARAERAVSRALGGSCTLPLGAFAEEHGSELRVRALVASADGRRIARADCRGPAADPEALGDRAARALKDAGAEEILRALQS